MAEVEVEQVGVNPNDPNSQEMFVKNSFLRFLQTYASPRPVPRTHRAQHVARSTAQSHRGRPMDRVHTTEDRPGVSLGRAAGTNGRPTPRKGTRRDPSVRSTRGGSST